MSPHKTLYLVFYCIVALMLMPFRSPSFITVRVCEVEGIWGVEWTHSFCVVWIWRSVYFLVLKFVLRMRPFRWKYTQSPISIWTVCDCTLCVSHLKIPPPFVWEQLNGHNKAGESKLLIPLWTQRRTWETRTKTWDEWDKKQDMISQEYSVQTVSKVFFF